MPLERRCAGLGHASRAPQPGLGQRRAAAPLDIAWSSGCYKVMLMTGRSDEAVFRLYEADGFPRRGKQAFIARP